MLWKIESQQNIYLLYVIKTNIRLASERGLIYLYVRVLYDGDNDTGLLFILQYCFFSKAVNSDDLNKTKYISSYFAECIPFIKEITSITSKTLVVKLNSAVKEVRTG